MPASAPAPTGAGVAAREGARRGMRDPARTTAVRVRRHGRHTHTAQDAITRDDREASMGSLS